MEIYYFDNETKKYSGFDVVPDKITDEQGQEQPYPVPTNATSVKPDFSLLGLYWDGQAWKGLSQEEYDKQNPPTPPEDWQPSQDDQQDAQTMLLIANLTQQIQEQQKLNAQMMLQIADLTKKVQQ